ncbi:MAG: phosphoglycerate dehydrogenase [Candidatus Fluviicola riflensis]|nr:MAG: phosphoglycerate dehydrogenase [Candidatus Fluviicola riflensis]OGS77957.1 MAG: phosphoglycerate dehydrogenase [Candidatus Fluviicola riflensis]OGS85022.1 MAG: phosphoglycerate dehydrogenase [Fluviicola sp. RIFCSPHIGHO2_01_FULL_43_53]OGS89294.1 MAG: phosphoglycerate dehydrogenase [Fluviicola sp. RIFCSPHIGHO2_12_FULL_43_24]
MEQKVIFLDTVHPILEQRLTELGFNCIDGSEWTFEETKSKLKDAFGIVIRSRFPMNEDLLANAVELQFIARSGAGMENIDEVYCNSREIVLFNAPEGNRNAVGEHALGMLLSLMNKLHTSHQEIRKGKWDRDGNRGVELDGKTVGIIGYGNNGRAFAKKLRGFDVKVLAYDKYKSGFGDDFVMEATLEALVSKADVISFHIPQNAETIYFANQEFFDALGKPIFLLNLSRGKIVETAALIRAIDTGKVSAAGLDVNEFEKSSFEAFFDDEASIPENLKSLLHSDQILMTPHIGGWTNESYFKLSNVLADKISDWWLERQP